jgi:superfamily II DNA or RNA helicase
MKLRPYQDEAVAKAMAALGQRNGERFNRPVVVIPTGGGKTVVFTEILRTWSRENPGRRILVLAHRNELIEQAAKTIRESIGDNQVGIVQETRNEFDYRFVVSSIQTMSFEKRRNSLINVGLVVVDECHHAVAPSWREVIEHFDCPTLGVTATTERADGLGLHIIWDEIVFEIPITALIRMGYLVNPVGIRVEIPALELHKVKRVAGDFSQASLGTALDEAFAPELVAEKVLEYAPDRPGILYAPTVSSAHNFADALNAAGLSTATVSGSTPLLERRRAVSDFGRGHVQWLANCAVFTEGFDAPRTSAVCIARPTQSSTLFRQMAGRALRPYPGKTDALILDVVGSTRTNRLVGFPSLLGRGLMDATTSQMNLLDLEHEVDTSISLAGVTVPYVGPVEDVEVDLLGRSVWRWNTTRGGNLVLSADGDYISIIDRGDGFAVMVAAKVHPKGNFLAERVSSIGEAFDIAEAHARSRGSRIRHARKSGSWLTLEATGQVLRTARSLGIQTAPGALVGDVLEQITVAEASARLDGPIDAWLAQEFSS